jgi:hypothetical protein
MDLTCAFVKIPKSDIFTHSEGINMQRGATTRTRLISPLYEYCEIEVVPKKRGFKWLN